MKELDRAEEALAAGDRAAALDALLRAWRSSRATEIAGLLDVVSADLGRALPPLEEGEGFHERWMEIEQRGSTADVPRLLPGLVTEPVSTLRLRLERLLARGADPRTGLGLLAMVEAIPTTASSNFSVWTMAFKALPTMIDGADAEVVKRLRKKKPGGKSNFWPKYAAWLEKLEEQLAEPVTLDAGTKKRVKAMLARAKELGRGAPPVEARAPLAAAASKKKRGPGAEGPLEAAREAAGANDWNGALSGLLAAWRELRSPEIAEVIVGLSRALRQESLVREPAGAAHAAWMALEARGRPADVPVLLDALTVGNMVDVEARLGRLAARGEDPRVGRRMRSLLDESPAGNRPVFWQLVFDLLAASGEAAHVDVVDRLGSGDPSAIGRGNLAFGNGPPMRRNAARVTDALRAQALAATALPRPLAGVLAAIEAAIPGPAADPEAAMLAAIAAAPGDDAPRLVYADWLGERGDPRGELIMVQCKIARGEGTKQLVSREKALLKNRGALLGPLAEIAFTKSERFERGLLVAMDPRLTSERQLSLIGHPLFATVREMNLHWTSSEAHLTALVMHPVMASLRCLRQVHMATVAALASSPRPLPIEELVIRAQTEPFPEEQLESLLDGRGLPALRVLGGYWWNDTDVPAMRVLGGEWLKDAHVPPRRYLESPMVGRLERLEIGSVHSAELPAVVAWVEAVRGLERAPLVRLVYGSGACDIEGGIVRARRSYADPRWVESLRAARSVAKALVLEGDWPADERSDIEA